MLLVCFILAYFITRAVYEGRVDQELARKGIVSPRLQAKYGDAAKAKTARYGALDFVADAWSDLWRDRTQVRREAVAAVDEASRPATAPEASPSAKPVRPSLRDRFRKVVAAAKKAGRRLVEPVEPRSATQPVSPPAVSDPPPAAANNRPDDDVRVCPDCGETLEPVSGGWIHSGGRPCPAHAQPAAPPQPTLPKQPVPPPHDEAAPTPRRKKPMTTATGEAVNYETTVAQLEALIAELRKWLEACIAALDCVEQAKNHITDMQQGYRDSAQIAAGILEHLAAMNLDATTLGLIGAIRDALPASAVDEMLAGLEECEERLKTSKENAATALAAAEAALQHVVAEYGEEAAKVASNLGGDPTFLGSGGGASAPVPAGSVAA